jgi:proteic killer suppression protein
MDMQPAALKRLIQLDAATALADLAVLSGLRLERLKGDRKNQHSIRINQQWRVCFAWGKDNHASDVEITDYH